jgi:predicted DCC family thiol-disulfide oxidoreductase YuxK
VPTAVNASAAKPVVFYDGDCGLCHSTVSFLLARDPEGHLRFATLQGEYAAGRVPAELRDVGPNGAVVLLEPEKGGRLSIRSLAILRALAHLGGTWRWAAWLAGLPGISALLDPVYSFVTRNRIRWFGRADACAFPDPTLRARFLD